MKRAFDIAAWVLASVTCWEWWSRVISHRLDVDYGTADIIAFQTLVEDVVVRGHAYWGAWKLTPAPYFFPDGLFALIARGVTALPEVAVPLTVWLQLLTLFGAAYFALRSLGVTLTSLACLLALAGHAPMKWLLYPVHHVGVVILMLLISGCFLQLAKSGRRAWGSAALIITLLGAVSDALFVAGVAVAALVVLVDARWRWWALAMLIVSIGGGQLTRLLVSFHVQSAQTIRLERVFTTMGRMANDLAHWPLQTQFFAGLMVVGWVFALVKQRRTMFFLWNLAGAGMVAAVIATANVDDGGWERYVLWPALAAMFSLGAAFMNNASLVVITLGVVGVFVRPLQWVSPMERPTSWWRAATECVERLADQEDAHVVVTDYWRAKPLVLFSTKLKAAPMQRDVSKLALWIMSTSWLGPKEQVALLITNDLDTTALDARIGPPTQTVDCESLHVRVYRGESRMKFADEYERWTQH